MGFYGNITNTAKTTFSFDKIYPNKYVMENQVNLDGVYMGRYVLVEYDEGVTPDETYYKAFYYNPADSWFYGSPAFEAVTKVRIVDKIPPGSTEFLVIQGDIVRERKTDSTYTDKFYIVKNGKFEFAIDTDSNYVRNFNIDRINYGESRGWDSTVWVKEYVNKKERYVQIAELNSVVPTFGITSDAPTQVPITPHFDQNSTNVYYKLHMQPQWGVRVAESEGHSDEQVTRETVTYNPVTGETETVTEIIDANIFFNKNALNVDSVGAKLELEDTVAFLPTGSSGILYNKHDGSGEMETANDIYEMSLILPSLGNTISDIWDLAYGSVRNQQIEWGNKDGLRVTKTGPDGNISFHPADAQTFAGVINSTQDVLGTIIKTEVKPVEDLVEEDLKYIYFDGTKYNRAHTTYVFAEATEEIYADKTLEFFKADGSGWNSKLPFAAGEIFTRSESYEYKELKDFAGKLNTLHGMLLKINSMLEFDSPDTRDLRTVQGSINVLNDLIKELGNLTPNEFMIVNDKGEMSSAPYEGDLWISPKIDGTAASPKVTVTHLVNKEEDTTSASDLNVNKKDTIELVTFTPDAMGHKVAENVETVTLPYGIKTIKGENSAAVTAPANDVTVDIVAKNLVDEVSVKASNKWIKVDTKDGLSLGHELTVATPNQKFGLEKDLTVEELDVNNTFSVPCFVLDEAGHIITAETHTVKVPDVFNGVDVVGAATEESDSSASSGSISADTLKGILSLGAGNKWIQLKAIADRDAVEFRHFVKIFTETLEMTDLDTSQTFPVQEIVWDNAGHIVSSVKRTYTLPDGFKTLSIGTASSSVEVGSSTGGDIIATTQNDKASIGAQNRWITLSASEKKVEIGHAAAGADIKTKGQGQDKVLTFGDTFKAVGVGIDQTGHTGTLNDYTVTLPSVSLTKDTTKNVMTGLALNPTSGAIAEEKVNVGNLELADYASTATGNYLNFSATDSINAAFEKTSNAVNINGDRILELIIKTRNLEAVNEYYFTLSPESWIGESSPFTQRVEFAAGSFYSSSSGYVGLRPGLSKDARDIIRSAMINVSEQGAGYLIMSADGEKPTSAIYCSLTIIKVGSR